MVPLFQQFASALRRKTAPRSAHYDANSFLPPRVYAPFLRPPLQALLCVGPSKGSSPPPFLSLTLLLLLPRLLPLTFPLRRGQQEKPCCLLRVRNNLPLTANSNIQAPQRKRPQILMESPPRQRPRLGENAQVAYPDASGVQKGGAEVCGGWRGFSGAKFRRLQLH